MMRIKVIQKIIDVIRNKSFYHKIHGKNNYINNKSKTKTKIIIYGDNNKVIIGSNVHNNADGIYIGAWDHKTNNCTVIIGDNTTSIQSSIRLMEDNSTVEIGKNCLISRNVEIECTDHHSIYDISTKKLINKGKTIKIGEHVWICRDVIVCKNTSIPNDCVVGARAVVTKEFEEPNCIITGIPAKIVKKDINWLEVRPTVYEKDTKI